MILYKNKKAMVCTPDDSFFDIVTGILQTDTLFESVMRALPTPSLDGVLCLYERERFGGRKEISIDKIHNKLRSLLNSDFVPDLHTEYLIYFQLLMESQKHLENIQDSYIILYPFFFLLFSLYKSQNNLC